MRHFPQRSRQLRSRRTQLDLSCAELGKKTGAYEMRLPELRIGHCMTSKIANHFRPCHVGKSAHEIILRCISAKRRLELNGSLQGSRHYCGNPVTNDVSEDSCNL